MIKVTPQYHNFKVQMICNFKLNSTSKGLAVVFMLVVCCLLMAAAQTPEPKEFVADVDGENWWRKRYYGYRPYRYYYPKYNYPKFDWME